MENVRQFKTNDLTDQFEYMLQPVLITYWDITKPGNNRKGDGVLYHGAVVERHEFTTQHKPVELLEEVQLLLGFVKNCHVVFLRKSYSVCYNIIMNFDK